MCSQHSHQATTLLSSLSLLRKFALRADGRIRLPLTFRANHGCLFVFRLIIENPDYDIRRFRQNHRLMLGSIFVQNIFS